MMMQEKPQTTPQATSFLPIVEYGTKLLGVIAAGMLVMSVFYDFCYLSALDLSFSDVPSLSAEHVRSALLWGPVAAAYALFVAGTHVFEWRRRTRLPESFAMRHSLHSFRRWKKGFMYAAMFTSLLFVHLILIARGIEWMYVIGALILACAILLYVALDEQFVKGTMGEFAVFFILPVIFMLVGVVGYAQGRGMANGITPSWELSIRVGTNVTNRTITGLRRFSTFAIVVDQERFVSIIPNDSILAARRLKKMVRPERNLCRWFNSGCDRVEAGKLKPLPTKPQLAPTPAQLSPTNAKPLPVQQPTKAGVTEPAR